MRGPRFFNAAKVSKYPGGSAMPPFFKISDQFKQRAAKTVQRLLYMQLIALHQKQGHSQTS